MVQPFQGRVSEPGRGILLRGSAAGIPPSQRILQSLTPVTWATLHRDALEGSDSRPTRWTGDSIPVAFDVGVTVT